MYFHESISAPLEEGRKEGEKKERTEERRLTWVVFQRRKGRASRRSSQWSRMQSLEMAIMGEEEESLLQGGKEGGREGKKEKRSDGWIEGQCQRVGMDSQAACSSRKQANTHMHVQNPSLPPSLPAYRAATVAYIQYKSSNCPLGMR
jgi:hypothetical protein